MKENISAYRILNKRLTGNTLKIFFTDNEENRPVMVLELQDVVVFIDSEELNNEGLLTLEIDKAGSYGEEISMKLKMPEVTQYLEVIIVTKQNPTTSRFRALARSATWRSFDNEINGDINY